ncbi:hypothetical protein [Loigolactobacillus jiayinensis]|uniref:Uncharacterized protein n=1 Tax=Loigolactobacillus jiayinensis TaxID=2486016 RepID=A0ABW1RCS6_9LACO|nr:hypothetical protein [Loigolactobacillus jiayinensis]
MIILDAPIQQDKIIALLNAYDQDGVSFQFDHKKGIQLHFTTNQSDLATAAKVAKAAIKAEPWGGVLYFQARVAK